MNACARLRSPRWGVQPSFCLRGARRLTCLLAVLFLALCSAPAAANGPKPDAIPISTIEQLQLIGNDPDYPLEGDYYLTGDIDASATEDWNGGMGFEPIGEYDMDGPSLAFAGSLDGQGHVITGLTISRPDEDAVGVFSLLSAGAVIHDLALENATVEGSWGVGVLAGGGSGTVTRCSAEGVANAEYGGVGGLLGWNTGPVSYSHAAVTVTGDRNAGGLVGVNSGAWAAIHRCYATGQVLADWDYAGGLVGWNVNGAISESFATGSVSGYYFAGGLVGENIGGTISECYATGMVEGGYFVGGLVGWNEDGAITHCYATGTVDGGHPAVGLLEHTTEPPWASFWDVETSGTGGSGGGKGLPTSAMTTRTTFRNAGWGNSVWVMAEGEYPRLAWEETGAEAIPPADPLPLAGSGTEPDPYRVTSPEEFALLSWYAEALGCHFLLDADVDCAGALIYPIGGLGFFSGVFDGQGHAVRNVTIDMPEGSFVGLFAQLGAEGEVRNLCIEDAVISGRSYVGGLAGENRGGTITNSCLTGMVTGSSHISGGLVGLNSGMMSQCHAAVEVTGHNYTGGLVGENQGEGAVSRCYATGSVAALNYAGGLVGANRSHVSESYATSAVTGGNYMAGGLLGLNRGTVLQCYAMGAVSSPDSAGGLVGWNSGAVSECYSAGEVTGTTDIGGLIGDNDGSVSGSYWDTETSGRTTSAGGAGAMGRTTDEMTHPYDVGTYAGWSFATIWGADADYAHNSGYPYLRAMVETEPQIPPEARAIGDFNNDGCVNFQDFMFLLENWGVQVDGTPMGFTDFMALLENWGAGC